MEHAEGVNEMLNNESIRFYRKKSAQYFSEQEYIRFWNLIDIVPNSSGSVGRLLLDELRTMLNLLEYRIATQPTEESKD
jgi:hypothetical protein